MHKDNIAYLEVSGLHKYYRQDHRHLHILDGLSFTVQESEFVTLLGPNGCGKTTLLRILAGLTNYDAGTVTIASAGPEANRKERKIGYVPQDYGASLFDWRLNIDNIGFGLELQGLKRKEVREQCLESVRELGIGLSGAELGLGPGSKRYPYQLSGGQKQRVALARALVHGPALLLMDEPFSALDVRTRPLLRREILKVWGKTKVTILFVSHDVEEALLLGDRLLVLSERPAKVLRVVDVDLPRPRKGDVMKTRRFLELRENVESACGESRV